MDTTETQNKKRKNSDISQGNDKQFLQDGMSTEDIRKTVSYIRQFLEKGGNMSIDDRINKLKTEHSFFAERYPMLFDMCVKKDFNYEHLNYFLNMRDKIINDKISSEDASIQVGKEWFNKFVDVSKLEQKK